MRLRNILSLALLTVTSPTGTYKLRQLANSKRHTLGDTSFNQAWRTMRFQRHIPTCDPKPVAVFNFLEDQTFNASIIIA